MTEHFWKPLIIMAILALIVFFGCAVFLALLNYYLAWQMPAGVLFGLASMPMFIVALYGLVKYYDWAREVIYYVEVGTKIDFTQDGKIGKPEQNYPQPTKAPQTGVIGKCELPIPQWQANHMVNAALKHGGKMSDAMLIKEERVFSSNNNAYLLTLAALAKCGYIEMRTSDGGQDTRYLSAEGLSVFREHAAHLSPTAQSPQFA